MILENDHGQRKLTRGKGNSKGRVIIYVSPSKTSIGQIVRIGRFQFIGLEMDKNLLLLHHTNYLDHTML